MILVSSTLIHIFLLWDSIAGQAISFVSPKNCSIGTTTASAEYFNTATLLCESCSQSTRFQKQSDDGLSCSCQPGYRIIKDVGGNTLTCEACNANETVTEDGLQCIPCAENSFDDSTETCKPCPSDSYSAFYSESGVLLPSQTCLTCGQNATATSEGCHPCSDIIRMLRASSLPESCKCPNTMVDGVCFPGITPTDSSNKANLIDSDPSPVVPTDSNELSYIYPANDVTSTNAIRSYYFDTQARAAVAYCSGAYKNLTACQLLANLCTLQLQRRYQLTVSSASTCAEFYRLTNERMTTRVGFTSWATDMPWLYYSPTKASTALKDTSITTQYSPKAQIDIRLATFALDGTFLGFQNAIEFGQLQLCKDTIGKMQAAFNFGTVYSQECELHVDDLFNQTKHPLVFYDPYLYFFDNTSNIGKLMPIPVLNRALIDNAGVLTNVVSEEDANSLSAALGLGNAASVASIESSIRDKWELTRRLFLVDNLIGRASDAVIPSTLVRYVSNIELKIFPRGSGFDGLIYPPLLAVDYDNLYSAEDFGKNKRVKVTFSVTYNQPTELEAVFEQNLRIAMGVICTMAACYGMIRTWLWSRRAGVLRLDGMLILKLILFVVGNVANGFLIVIYCVSIYFLIFYKLQTSFMVSLPNSDQFMVNYIAAAFALKCLDIAHLMAVQCTVDIFFMDWERPKFPTSKLIHRTGGDDPDLYNIDGTENEVYGESKGLVKMTTTKPSLPLRAPYEDSGISVWRTIYVANEWNEIQTHRKTQSPITYGAVLLFMQVIGFEKMASSDPYSAMASSSLEYQSEESRIFRIALILSIVLITGILQWFLLIVVWERCFEDKLRSFADLCSITNVSVFVLAQANFGYYIHGHCPTGRSDVDMGGLELMLATERSGNAPRRGIMADSDRHTYRMALPAALRKAFDRLHAPLQDISTSGPSRGPSDSVHYTTLNDVYQTLNRFLMRFISRDNTEGLRFKIVRKRALEDLLDGEFDDTSLEGLFYIDNGNSFGDVLFYGNEIQLFIFDALLFCLVDLLSQNLILDLAVTLIVGKLICILRGDLGRRNVVKKAVIHERFLL